LDTSQYMTLFIEESEEIIENLNQSMLELEKEPDNVGIVNEIFRYAHTIKGMAATMGFTSISELTHSMENILDKMRNSELSASTEIVTLLFKCLDRLEAMLYNVSQNEDANLDCSDLIEQIETTMNGDSGKATNVSETKADAAPAASGSPAKAGLELNKYDKGVLATAKEKKFNSFRIDISLRSDCQLKAARAYLIFNNLEQHGEIIKSNPPAEDIEKEEFDTSISLVFVTQKDKAFIKHLVENISEIEYVSVDEITDADTKQVVETQVSASNKMKESKPQKASPARAGHSKKLSQSVRVDLDRLDKLMNLVGELVIHRTRLEQISSSYGLTELNETLEQVGRTTSDLQDIVMKVRMIPLESVFSRLPRMVRDLSTELDKDIDFTIKGQETELDRTVVDELGESIIHILRNAVDHGIESREERIKAGKSETGVVTITAYQEGNKAVIVVEDDGGGLDTEKIRSKAIEKGIYEEGMSDDDINNLIFHEGLSTSDKITDVSGRGVGLDVVKNKITSIGGTVDLKSELGKGTSFYIHLPLTLSIIQALLVKVGDETFAISQSFIEKVINISKGDIKLSNMREIIIYRDDVIPVVRLSKKLNLKNCDKDDDNFIVIVKTGEKRVGLMVDSLVGQQEIVIKSLGKSLKTLKEYVGATILGDGHVTLILDVVSLI